VFVYLFRAFRLEEPAGQPVVYLWHGDPMARAILVAVLFSIGLMLIVLVSVYRVTSRREGSLKVRADIWDWLVERADQTNQTPEQLAERALAAYRSRLEHNRSHLPIG
jgi:hypothetical protein